jgi:tetratricopeptide (TPR) repeat protein
VAEARQQDPARIPDSPAADRAVADRLGQVVRSVRRLCGGRYARWQDLLDRGDISGLVAFAESPGALEFRSGLLAALGRDLQRVGQYPAMRSLLRAAVERYPREAWLHFDLAYSSQNLRPPDYAEALCHMSAATVLRPDSVLFHLHLGECYAGLGSYDRAIAAYRQAIRLSPGSGNVHRWLGRLLLSRKDWDGAIAAFRGAIRLKSDDTSAHVGLGTALVGAGRPAEGLRVALDALRQDPERVEDPRSYFRYNTACLALNCADGQGGDAPPSAERAEYRKQALDLLTAELAAIRRLAGTDPAWVDRRMRHWLADKDLTSVRQADAVDRLPPEERDAWNRLWADVRALRDGTASRADSPPRLE